MRKQRVKEFARVDTGCDLPRAGLEVVELSRILMAQPGEGTLIDQDSYGVTRG